MPPKKSKTQLLLESDPDAVLTKKGRAPSTMSETALEKLKLAREKYQTTCRLKREAKLKPVETDPVPVPPAFAVVPVVPEPVVPVVPVPAVSAPVESEEEDEPVEPPVVIKKKPKKPKKPVVIIEESASDSDDNSNVIFIKKRSNKPKPIPAELPAVPIEPAVIRREFIQPVYAKNPFYNYTGY